MKQTTRTAVLALTATAVVLAASGTATADTNKSEQASAVSGPLAAVLSPATAPSDNAQGNRQVMDKAHAANWSLIDYAGNARPGKPSKKKPRPKPKPYTFRVS
ncbi:hypothetical protein ABZ626_02210 [Streptomyces longispororuber]|uniref:hypothetical protein n=1 Tax=Streptomyces longispororuber TaxID=68230 RepID=UPI00340C4C7D